jgi:hypothetical protein
MRVKFKRRTSAAALWSRRMATFAFVLLAVSAFSHRFIGIETANLFRLVMLSSALATVALFLAAYGLRQLWTHGDRAGMAAMGAIGLAFVTLAPVGLYAVLAATRPALTDISTDLEDPPAFAPDNVSTQAEGNALDTFPPDTAQLQTEAYPGVVGRRYNEPADIVIQAVTELAAQRGWTVEPVLGTPGSSAEVLVDLKMRSFVLGLYYSAVVRITDEDVSTYVDMRSASHYGVHDFGANARRIEDFLRDLDFAVATLGS